MDSARNMKKFIMAECRRGRDHGWKWYRCKVMMRHVDFILNEMQSLEDFNRELTPFIRCKMRQSMVGHPTDWDDICKLFQL